MQVENSITINCPVEEVFDYAGDPDHVPEWSGPVISTQKTSSGAPGKGTTAVSKVKVLGRQFDVPSENTEWDRPHAFTVKNTGGPMPMTMNFRFSPEGDGTRVDLIANLELSGMLNMATALMEPVVNRQMQSSLDAMKAMLESRVAAATGSQTE